MHRSPAPWALVVLCLHCGGSPPPPSTEAPPPSEATAAPAEAPSPPADTAAPAEAATGSAPAAPADTPKKKTCAELDKTNCKITTGCAWNELKKCVEEGP